MRSSTNEKPWGCLQASGPSAGEEYYASGVRSARRFYNFKHDFATSISYAYRITAIWLLIGMVLITITKRDKKV